ncbi:DNA polymerase III subunit delta [Tepiditoga spiralis]|uniref:DNA polymerase III subunit delta n=1 Tax=Tepiditoga spiralis TaxID=2108365 RepID=A0A7G1G8Z0_9BACT|nr:hypothetical protein [Tepiditoga spiralis]BBE31906.1 DNA polymerase III subunit delta [Tepiditoga spiralis]
MKKILIYGDSLIKKELIIKKFFTNNNFEKLSKENYTFEKINTLLSTRGMFTKKKDILIENFDDFKTSQKKEITSLLNNEILTDGILIVSSKKEIKNINFDEKKKAFLPKPWEEDKWIKFINELAEPKKIKNEASEYLLSLLGNNDLYLYGEIKKLKIYSNEFITFNDVVEIGSNFSKSNLEDFFYYLSSKKINEVIKHFKNISNNDFDSIMFNSFAFKYFFDLYKVISFVEKKNKYTWPEVEKIKNETKVNSQRVRNFLGINFKNDKIKKINLVKLYEIKELRNILIEIEKIDRKLKIGADHRVIFLDFFEKVCRYEN